MTIMQEHFLAAIVTCLLPVSTETIAVTGTAHEIMATVATTTAATVIKMATIATQAETREVIANPTKTAASKAPLVRAGTADSTKIKAAIASQIRTAAKVALVRVKIVVNTVRVSKMVVKTMAANHKIKTRAIVEVVLVGANIHNTAWV